MNFLSGSKQVPSNIGQLIDIATVANETEDKYELFYEISDLINIKEENSKEAMRAIRKKLNTYSGNNWSSVGKLLKLLEICSSNCNGKFQVQLANKEFLNELKAMIGPKHQPPIVIQEMVLSLIQQWSVMFKSRSDMKSIENFCTELKMKGIEFPVGPSPFENKLGSTDLNRTPTASILGPTVKSSQSHRAVVPNAAQAVHLNEDQTNKLKNELHLVDVNIIIMNEIITEYQPINNNNDINFLKEIYLTTSEMQKRITQLIGNVSNENIISELLRINDDLNNVFLRYDRFNKRSNLTINPEITKKSQTVVDEKPLIDFGSDPISSSNVNFEASENIFLADENEIEEMETWLKTQELENSKTNSTDKN